MRGLACSILDQRVRIDSLRRGPRVQEVYIVQVDV
jgi:hypothetical protein